jgi:hypothetical protein
MEALDAYEDEAGQKSAMRGELGKLRSLKSLDEIVGQLDSSKGDFAMFRQRRAALRSRVIAFAKPLRTVLDAAVTTVSLTDLGIPATAVMAAAVHVIKACENVSQSYDYVEQMFEELQAFSDRLNKYLEEPIHGAVDGPVRKEIVGVFKL